MQHIDIKNDLKDLSVVTLKWNGEDTRVRLEKSTDEKTDVAKGATIEVTVERAKQLLRQDRNWQLVEKKAKEAKPEAEAKKPVKKPAKKAD